MKKITKYFVGALCLAALVGCKDKMRELNTNPDIAGSTEPEYMFLNAVNGWGFNSRDYYANEWTGVGQLMQYWTHYNYSSVYNDGTKYTQPSTLSRYWSDFYGKGQRLYNLQVYLRDNVPAVDQPKYADLNAISGIIKVRLAFQIFRDFGAAVYSQAFKAISEGITKPGYDIYKDVYKELDTELKGYIATLSAEPAENVLNLGNYDYFYGWKTNVGGAPSSVGNYKTQRTNWMKFANAIRLDMAWTLKQADEALFTTVLNEVTADPNNLMTALDEGCYYRYAYNTNHDLYNSSDISSVSVDYYMTDNFLTHLKKTGDPRLPLLARTNSLILAEGVDNDYAWMKKYYPDSLQKRQVYDEDTKTWSEQNWNGLLDPNGNQVFMGMSADPAQKEVPNNPGQLLGQTGVTYRFYHPDYIEGDTEHNNKLQPWTVTAKDGSGDTYEIKEPVKTVTLTLASHMQGRYYVPAGGKSTGAGTDGYNGGDGPTEGRYSIYVSRPVYTYVEQCFMLAYLSADLGKAVAGKSAADWYKAGVEAALTELANDSKTYQIQIAYNTAFPKIPGVNPEGLYSMTPEMISSYVTANSNVTKETITTQAWVYLYNQPGKMWTWWRLTGYPSIVSVTMPDERPDFPFLYQPHKQALGGEGDLSDLGFPRRCILPQPNTLNNDNYDIAKKALIAEPGYGNIVDQTSGRIFWDKALPVVQN